MPNWCNTEYIFFGEEQDLKACGEVINKFAFGNISQDDKKYGTYQLIDREIGGSLDGQDARNDFLQAEIETLSDGKTYLQTWTQTAWRPDHGLADKLCKKFNLTYLYYAEEPGCQIYETNDREGLFFPERFIIEQSSAETCTYIAEQELYNEISKRTGKVCNDFESMEEIIEDYNIENENDRITATQITVK